MNAPQGDPRDAGRRVPGWLVLAVLVVIVGGLGWVIWNGPRR